MKNKDHRVFTQGARTDSLVKEDSLNLELESIKNENYFKTAIVTEFIGNPDVFLDQTIEVDQKSINNSLRQKIKGATSAGSSTMKEELIGGNGKVNNPYMVSVMPRNSIMGYCINDGRSHLSLDQEIFFPFFPQHIGMPVKAGEQVWIFYENINGKKIGYWLFRKTGTLQVDDLNYTHIDRQGLIAPLMQNIKSTAVNKSKVETLMNNYGYRFADPNSGGDGSGNSPVNYDAIALNSISYKNEFIGEAVPRHTKKCGDLVLQGSNNTVISLTHSDAVGTGTIVLAAGKSLGSNVAVKNKRGKSAKSIEHDEIQKFAGVFGRSSDTIDEGTVDTASASIVITETAGGSVKIGNSVGAYIELKTNGDICIVPADQGVIRLGGEDADKAMLGMTGADAAGIVTGVPIISTMGGVIGSGGAPGSFASKIMVK
jgi:hypothetical protein